MTDTISKAIAESWTFPFVPTIACLFTGAIYLRGWRLARVTRPDELPPWRSFCFIAGLLVLWLALASPMDALGQFLLVAHMLQHLLLMSVAPPLLVLGAPTVPLLRGLPRNFVREDLSPWMTSNTFHAIERFLAHPIATWLLMNVLFLGWHIPAAYELALRSQAWHDIEHACFFLGSLPFWWFVIRPWPSKSRWSRWLILPYLMLADIANTVLSASLAFCGRVVYPTYASAPRIVGISALQDQVAAGAGMWVVGSVLFLCPLVIISAQILRSKRYQLHHRLVQINGAPVATPHNASLDLLKIPGLSSLLRSRYGRASFQVLSLSILAIFIIDGIRGVQLSGLNLTGTVTWNIVRPLMLLLFLLAGNLFCFACPFTLPRELARALGLAKYNWPAVLRNKWLAVVLLIVFFWAYEQLALWNSPAMTAWLLLGYLLTAFVVDSFFKGASFCKYVCPIGQFNFVSSLLSPVELKARRQSACSDCSTQDCIRGNSHQRGCELQLYVPNKVGNLDCTLCMDCVKACPHDNIGLIVQSPTRELSRDPLRSSIGRLSSRVDMTVVLLVITFSAIINAGLMITPVSEFLGNWQSRYPVFGTNAASLFTSLVFSGVLLACVLGVAKILQSYSNVHEPQRVLGRFALALLPLGLSMWAAHLIFHLVTASSSLLPALQQAWSDVVSLPQSRAFHNVMHMAMSNSMPTLDKPYDIMLWHGARGIDLLTVQIWMLNIGLLFSFYAAWRTVHQMSSTRRNATAMLSIWMLSSGCLYALCIWVFTQPMEMRGMGM